MPQKVTPMELKTTTIEGVTYAVVQDGKPVYVDAGRDLAMDVPAMSSKITQLNGEAQGHRTAKETAEAALKKFEGIEDPAKAIAALATVANLDQSKLIEAGKVEEIKAAAIQAVEERYKPVVAERDSLQGELYAEKIGGSFARSPLIVGDKAKFAIPADIVQSHFGKHFKIEDGKVAAYDAAGNKIYSKASPGNPATFDEALELIVDAYPHKETILKGTGAQGSGAQGGSGKPGSIDVSNMTPQQKMAAGRAAAASR